MGRAMVCGVGGRICGILQARMPDKTETYTKQRVRVKGVMYRMPKDVLKDRKSRS
jgi:hypothetical protein